jgi:hypothetical protein
LTGITPKTKILRVVLRYSTVPLYHIDFKEKQMHQRRSALVQDLSYKEMPELRSSASEVECYICGKGLEDGRRITAKTLPNGTVLFCDIHYSLQ